ncbi:MAG: type II toxin-antitoxin system VapC family toxin [Dehalococcoidia bacterium]
MASFSGVVLDASAILAFLLKEPGRDEVDRQLEAAVVSSVNWAEVVQKGLTHQLDAPGLREGLETIGLQIAPFTAEDAEGVATLWPQTRSFGLSLADRACLTLAHRLGLPAWTTDRVWARLTVDVEVHVIR